MIKSVLKLFYYYYQQVTNKPCATDDTAIFKNQDVNESDHSRHPEHHYIHY